MNVKCPHCYGTVDSRQKESNQNTAPGEGTPLQGYSCVNPDCARTFYVAGVEEAYLCPHCGTKEVQALVGPFHLAAFSVDLSGLRAKLDGIYGRIRAVENCRTRKNSVCGPCDRQLALARVDLEQLLSSLAPQGAIRATMNDERSTAEQRARDLLDRIGMPSAQEMSAGDVVELANLFAALDNKSVAMQRLQRIIDNQNDHIRLLRDDRDMWRARLEDVTPDDLAAIHWTACCC